MGGTSFDGVGSPAELEADQRMVEPFEYPEAFLEEAKQLFNDSYSDRDLPLFIALQEGRRDSDVRTMLRAHIGPPYRGPRLQQVDSLAFQVRLMWFYIWWGEITERFRPY